MENGEVTKLVDAIGTPAMFEMMAEEATELSYACQKFARYLRGENLVHGKTEEEMLANVHEEMADVYVTLRELRKVTEYIDNVKICDTMDEKRKRMATRLGLKEDSFIF